MRNTCISAGEWCMFSRRDRDATQRILNKTEEVQEAEENLSKNHSRVSYEKFATHIGTHLQVKDTLINHYGQSFFKKANFDSYSRRCSVMQQVTSILATRIHRLEEKGPVLVAWGDGHFSPSFGKGYPTTPMHSIKDMLASKLKDSFVLVDEYLTSQKCPRCFTQCHSQKHGEQKIRGIQVCSHGHQWNRDKMASINIASV